MKTSLSLLTLGCLLAAGPLSAQNQPVPILQPPGVPRGFTIGALGPGVAPEKIESDMLPFDLDFPGGTPIQLVKAMEKAIGKPLNVIVPEELATFKLPALKMNQVTAYQLFTTMEQASQKSVRIVTGSQSFGSGGHQEQYQQFTEAYGFRTIGNWTPRAWFFHQVKAPQPPPVPKQCRFYQLAPYFQFTNPAEMLQVEDITTAIKTGWRMSQVKEEPEMNFHKETQLLIVVGEPAQLAIIDDVLKALASRLPVSLGGSDRSGRSRGGSPSEPGTPSKKSQ